MVAWGPGPLRSERRSHRADDAMQTSEREVISLMSLPTDILRVLLVQKGIGAQELQCILVEETPPPPRGEPAPPAPRCEE